jgi:RNA polymerase sigma factor (sigma-70 family)
MAGATADLLRHVHQLMAVHADDQLTDHQLLERFRLQRDEAAFALLVRRHGPMVLGVCRRVLHHEQDAEDAFQAAFLILARKAGAIRRIEVGGFLYRVAYHLAIRARANTAKRRQRDKRREAMSAADPLTDVTWREVRHVVDEEVQRLPDSLRSAVVLCYVEGRTHEEAARLLGWSKGTLRRRLGQGRELLRTRLVSRGLAPTAALTAALFAEGAATAAVSRALTGAAVSAAMGTRTSPAVTALAEGGIELLGLGKKKLATLIVLVVSLLTGAGVWAHCSLAEPPAETAKPDAEKPAKAGPSDRVVLTGRVLGPDGKPVQGVGLFSPHALKDPPELDEDVVIVRRGVTGPEGRFRIELPREDYRPDWVAFLIAHADGYGMDWIELPKGDKPAELTLLLIADQAIRGRILSTEGQPLAGVHVAVGGLMTRPGGRLDDFLAAWEEHWQDAQHRTPKRLELLPETVASAITDKNGRFCIQGIGAERVAILRLRGKGIPHSFLYVVVRAGFDPTAVNKAALNRFPIGLLKPGDLPLLYGPSFDLVAPPARVIEGTVRERGTGKPVAGFRVSSNAAFDIPVEAISDAQGRYHLEGLPKMKEYLLDVEPPANSSWLRTGASIEDTKGLQPLKVDFTVAHGIILTGRLIDRTSGKGVEGSLYFTPLPGNKFVDQPGYDSFHYNRYANSTDAEGRFRLTLIPGPGVLQAAASLGEPSAGGLSVNPYRQGRFDDAERQRVGVVTNDDGEFFVAADNSRHFPTYHNALKVLDLTPDAGTVKLDLFFDRGATRTVKLEDPDGQPLAGVMVSGVAATGQTSFTLPQATFAVVGLDAQKPRRLVFLHRQRRLGGTLTVRGDAKEPIVVRLVPTGTVVGRLLDFDGQPVEGVMAELGYEDGTAGNLNGWQGVDRPTARTGKDGRFRLENAIPGLKFGVGLRRGRTFLIGEPRIGLQHPRQVKPGETLDLGDVRVKPSR